MGKHAQHRFPFQVGFLTTLLSKEYTSTRAR